MWLSARRIVFSHEYAGEGMCGKMLVMDGRSLQPVLLVAACVVMAPVVMGGSSCHPHAPAPLPPPQSLEKVDKGDVIVTLAGGGGGDFQVFGSPTVGGGVALATEYRPLSELGLSGSMTVGRGGNSGVGTQNVLFQYGAGVDLYMPAPRLGFHPLLFELDLHVTHLSNRSVTFSPSVAVSTGFVARFFEACATLRLGWGIPHKRGRILVIDSDGDTAYLTTAFHLQAGVVFWFHIKRAAIGPFFRYLHAKADSDGEYDLELIDVYLVGGLAVRYRF